MPNIGGAGEQRHAVRTKGCEQMRAPDLFQDGAPGGKDFLTVPHGHPGALARFLRIRREQERAAVQADIARLGIDQDLHLMRAGGEQPTQAGHERQGDDALAVIGQDDHIVRRKLFRNDGKQGFLIAGGKRAGVLAVQAQHLLAPGHDAGFHRGRTLRQGHERAANAFITGEPPDTIGGGILAHHAHERRYAAKRHDIAGHIARAAEQVAFLFDPDDGDGRFRGNAIRVAYKIGIQHNVADDQHAPACQPAHDIGRQENRGHVRHGNPLVEAHSGLASESSTESPRRLRSSASCSSDS